MAKNKALHAYLDLDNPRDKALWEWLQENYTNPSDPTIPKISASQAVKIALHKLMDAESGESDLISTQDSGSEPVRTEESGPDDPDLDKLSV